jgi:type IV pilus assembly protein PilO
MNYATLRDYLNARPRALALLGLLVAANVSLAVYLSAWQTPELERVQSDWFAKRQAQAAGQRLKTADRFRNGNRDLAAFRQRLIPKTGFPAFLGDLFQAAHNNSLQLKSVTYKPTVMKDEALVAYGIEVTVVGRYAAVKSFLADLARYPQIVTLNSLTLNNASRTEESVELKVQLTAYLRQEGT